MGMIKCCDIEEFVWGLVIDNGNKIDEIDSSREGLKPKGFCNGGMDKESMGGFSDVPNFPLSNPILLRGVRTRDLIGNTMGREIMGKRTFCKFRGTITLEEFD